MNSLVQTMARALALFSVIIMVTPVSAVQPERTRDFGVANLAETRRPLQITVQYTITGMPQGTENFSHEEWIEYRDSLSDTDREIIRSQMSVIAEVVVKGTTIVADSEGWCSIANDQGNATGEVKAVANSGVVAVLQSMDGEVMATWAWPGSRHDNFLSLETEESGQIKTIDVVQISDAGSIWSGSRTFAITSQQKVSGSDIIGGDLRIGSNPRWAPWAWLTGTAGGAVVVVVGAVASVAYAAKCTKDALWDSYDCTPGTIACRCNGCTGC